MVAVFPFMVTVPEVHVLISEQGRNPGGRTRKASLWAPPVIGFLILVPVLLNPRLPSVSEAEPFSRLIPVAPVLSLVSTNR